MKINHAIALDIGGTGIKYALVDEKGDITKENIIPTETDGVALSVNLVTVIKECLDFAISNDLKIAGIGIGVPSVVDDGNILFANNLPAINNKNLPELLKQFGLPVFVENDANMMALGESRYGAAKGLSDIVFLTIGTGVGGALILNGKLYGGYHNRGTELGHIIVDANGSECTCGTARGCLEAHVSVSALLKKYKSLFAGESMCPANVDGRYVVERYLENQPEAIETMEDHFHYLSLGIASFINVFAPQKVIIGGGISEAGDFYIDRIRELAMKTAMRETSEFTTIDRASLGNKAGFMGAAALVFERF